MLVQVSVSLLRRYNKNNVPCHGDSPWWHMTTKTPTHADADAYQILLRICISHELRFPITMCYKIAKMALNLEADFILHNSKACEFIGRLLISRFTYSTQRNFSRLQLCMDAIALPIIANEGCCSMSWGFVAWRGAVGRGVRCCGVAWRAVEIRGILWRGVAWNDVA